MFYRADWYVGPKKSSEHYWGLQGAQEEDKWPVSKQDAHRDDCCCMYIYIVYLLFFFLNSWFWNISLIRKGVRRYFFLIESYSFFCSHNPSVDFNVELCKFFSLRSMNHRLDPDPEICADSGLSPPTHPPPPDFDFGLKRYTLSGCLLILTLEWRSISSLSDRLSILTLDWKGINITLSGCLSILTFNWRGILSLSVF